MSIAPQRANGGHVTRAELGAHLERIDQQLVGVHTKLDALDDRLNLSRRWMFARFTTAIDRGLVVVAAAVIAYIASHS